MQLISQFLIVQANEHQFQHSNQDSVPTWHCVVSLCETWRPAAILPLFSFVCHPRKTIRHNGVCFSFIYSLYITARANRQIPRPQLHKNKEAAFFTRNFHVGTVASKTASVEEPFFPPVLLLFLDPRSPFKILGRHNKIRVNPETEKREERGPPRDQGLRKRKRRARPDWKSVETAFGPP